MFPSDKPQLWLLAGGNGAGKSTFYQRFLAPRDIPFINADLIARRLHPEHPEALSYQAARIAETLRSDLLEKRATFCFETVFSHPSKIDFLAEAKARGYRIELIYIHLESTELNQARVAQRVSEGGHNVPAEKIVTRIPRTLRHIHTALPLADVARFYDNSSFGEPFRTVAHLESGVVTPLIDPLPEWAKTLLSDTP